MHVYTQVKNREGTMYMYMYVNVHVHVDIRHISHSLVGIGQGHYYNDQTDSQMNQIVQETLLENENKM